MASASCISATSMTAFMVKAFCSIVMAFHFHLTLSSSTMPQNWKNGNAVEWSTAKKQTSGMQQSLPWIFSSFYIAADLVLNEATMHFSLVYVLIFTFMHVNHDVRDCHGAFSEITSRPCLHSECKGTA